LLLVASLLMASALLLRIQRLTPHKPNIVLALVCSLSVLLILLQPSQQRWIGILPILPPMLVVHQAIFVWLHRPKEASAPADDQLGKTGMPERATRTIESYYNVRTIFVRYGFPATLLLLEGLILAHFLVQSDALGSLPGHELILRGARLGTAGAFCFVLLELGRRSFRHDVTGGAALWAVVTIAVGPLLAGTVAVLWKLETPKSDAWQSGLVLFFAGFAPRRMLAAIEQAAVQLLNAGPSAAVETRTLPLTKVRGITPAIEERLAEEGIYDVYGLAAAEPIRLVRNTSFDLRQILWWIDEALLIANVPRGWAALEDVGISGAIDLANYALVEPTPPELAKLGELASMTPELLWSTISRLRADAQVLYIWTLYNRFTEEGSGSQESEDE